MHSNPKRLVREIINHLKDDRGIRLVDIADKTGIDRKRVENLRNRGNVGTEEDLTKLLAAFPELEEEVDEDRLAELEDRVIQLEIIVEKLEERVKELERK